MEMDSGGQDVLVAHLHQHGLKVTDISLIFIDIAGTIGVEVLLPTHGRTGTTS